LGHDCYWPEGNCARGVIFQLPDCPSSLAEVAQPAQQIGGSEASSVTQDKEEESGLLFCLQGLVCSWLGEGYANYSDEATFCCMRSIKTRVRRAKRSDCFDSHIMSVTVITPGLSHGWGCFSGAAGQLGLYFLPKKYTMSGERYLEVVATHLIPFMSIHGITHFLQGRALCHISKRIRDYLSDKPF
jgi:hypothetical protein